MKKFLEHPKAGLNYAYAASLLLALTIVGYPVIAPISLIIEVPNRLISVPFRALVLALALSIIIRHLLVQRLRIANPFWLFWWFFWSLYLMRILIDATLNPEAMRLSLVEYLLMSFGICFLPALALGIIPLIDHKRAVRWLLAIGTVAIIVNLWLIFQDLNKAEILELAARRRFTETLNPIALSNLGVSLIIVALWSLFRYPSQSLLNKVFFLSVVVAGSFAALVGASRGPFLALLAVTPLLLYELYRQQRLTRRYLSSVAMTIVVVISAVSWLAVNFDKMTGLNRIKGGFFDDSIRMELYKTGIDSFIANPILGAGLEPIGFYPHNVILESFMLYGIVSGVIFIFLLSYSLLCALRNFVNNSEISWLSLLFFQYAIIAMFSGSLYSSPQFWVLMALSVSSIKYQLVKSTQ